MSHISFVSEENFVTCLKFLQLILHTNFIKGFMHFLFVLREANSIISYFLFINLSISLNYCAAFPVRDNLVHFSVIKKKKGWSGTNLMRSRSYPFSRTLYAPSSVSNARENLVKWPLLISPDPSAASSSLLSSPATLVASISPKHASVIPASGLLHVSGVICREIRVWEELQLPFLPPSLFIVPHDRPGSAVLTAIWNHLVLFSLLYRLPSLTKRWALCKKGLSLCPQIRKGAPGIYR